MLAIPFSQNSALKVWLYYLPNQLFLIYLGCYALYQLRIDPLSALAKKYLRFIGWLSIGFGVAILLEDTFVILTLTNILILSLKLTTETFLKIFIQSFSRSPLSTSVIVIFLCRFLKRRAKLEENQSDEPVLLAPFCDAYQLTRENEKCFRYF